MMWGQLLAIIFCGHVALAQGPEPSNRRLVWQDDFNHLDPQKWEHDVTAWGGGNLEFQVYIPDVVNSYVKNGHLHITPTLYEENVNPSTGRPYGQEWLRKGTLDIKEVYGRCTNEDNYGCFRDRDNIPPVASASLRSRGHFSFLYGTVEIRAKLPAGDWMWPAIWLLPDEDSYGGWPYRGEIDVVESLGNRHLTHNGESIGANRVISALHFCRSPINGHLFTGTRTLDKGAFADDFHVFTMDWKEDGFHYSVDGSPYLHVPNKETTPKWSGFGKHCRDVTPWPEDSPIAPFDKKFYLIINVAVGGMTGLMPDDAVNRNGEFPKPWLRNQTWKGAKNSFLSKKNEWHWTWTKSNGDPESLIVDYIRVYDSKSFISNGNKQEGDALTVLLPATLMLIVSEALR